MQTYYSTNNHEKASSFFLILHENASWQIKYQHEKAFDSIILAAELTLNIKSAGTEGKLKALQKHTNAIKQK